jgi:hypothetical protein
MILEKTIDHTFYRLKGPKFDGCADVQALLRSINTAHEKGALFFLAVQLASVLEEHYEKNGPITPLELETTIAQVSKRMLSQ